jgi:glycosyltransferase involved in cell wall biosynthesis
MLFNVLWCDIIFVRFADYYGLILAFYSKVFRKDLIIVEGGLGAYKYLSINDGAYINRIRGWCASAAFRAARWILPVDKSLIYDENTYTTITEEKTQGITYYNPRIKPNKIIVVNNGYDGSVWFKEQGINKEPVAVTTAILKEEKTFKRKGIDYFITLARCFPDCRFIIIGMEDELRKRLVEDAPNNLEVHAFLTGQEIREIYSKAKLYIQLSITEGMPNALCEAMLCECIPVGSNVNGIPNIIGDTGYIVFNQDIDEMKDKISEAFHSNNNLGRKARERIMQEFSIEKRKKNLMEIVNKE